MTDAPLILALDISKTNTGVAEGRAGTVPLAYSISGKDLDVVEALSKLGTWLINRINIEPPDWIFVEAAIDAGAFRPNIDWEKREWSSTRDPHTSLVLAKMVGIVEFIAYKRSIRLREANVRTARVAFIGKGNLKGYEAKRRVRGMCAELGWSATNNDQSDALCVWHYGCTIAAPRLSAAITPMMMSRVATHVGGVDMGDNPELLKRAGVR